MVNEHICRHPASNIDMDVPKKDKRLEIPIPIGMKEGICIWISKTLHTHSTDRGALRAYTNTQVPIYTAAIAVLLEHLYRCYV